MKFHSLKVTFGNGGEILPSDGEHGVYPIQQWSHYKIFKSSYTGMLHLYLGIWKILCSELWLENASPLPFHQALPCPFPLATWFESTFSLNAQNIPQPHTQTELTLRWNLDPDSLAASHVRGIAATIILANHWLALKTWLRSLSFKTQFE